MRTWSASYLSIKQNLALSAIFQVIALVVVIFFTYFSRIGELRQDLDERGALIAATVAESSQYGLVSGNYTYIHSAIRRLLAANKDIYSVQVTDKTGTAIVNLRSSVPDAAETLSYASPVTIDVSDVNLVDFESSDATTPASLPRPSASLPSPATSRPNSVIGNVHVTLSPASLIGAKRNRLLVGLGLAGGFLLLSIADGFRRSRALTRPLIDILAAIRGIREGSYSVRFRHKAGPELTELQSGIVEMAANLRTFHQGLEDLVVERTRALEEARDEALRASADRKLLIERASTAAEAERQAIAVDIHDHLNALVVVARLEAKALVKLAKRIDARRSESERLGADTAGESSLLDQRADTLLRTVTDLYQMGRNIIKRLRPEMLETLGLDAAVSEIVAGYNSVSTTCRFEYASSGPFLKMDSNVALSAYRLIQESISNIMKHAQASQVKIDLTLSEEDRMLRLAVVDNGKGFDMRNYQAGIGLIGMRERVSALGGVLNMQSSPGNGTAIRAEFPVQI
jgi:two-component system sensor histidine kinase UhpB